ncbi:response regulator transcription factor [Aquabacterium sp.]|jgi:two-component system response regulator QseB|uniref:response regulator transcription factor n=1 Tax=Aquabacterium sp. TaxID=1872578 RepID=UPI0027B9D9A6|nr:response regulator transcription factor [Aquabacterium sp.]
MRVLLVEDDVLLGDGLQQGLIQQGYAVDWLQRGDEAEAALMAHRYDCVVLDWQLPGLSGVDVLQRLRARRDTTPVLLLTARDALSDRIAGLDVGADDYLVKPVALDELGARLRARMRRALGQASPVFTCGALVLDPARRVVTLRGEAIDLSAREFNVLSKLISQPGRPYSQAQLIESLYAWDEDVSSNAIEVYIYQLRRKLGAEWIKTLRGVGYMLNPVGEA